MFEVVEIGVADIYVWVFWHLPILQQLFFTAQMNLYFIHVCLKTKTSKTKAYEGHLGLRIKTSPF